MNMKPCKACGAMISRSATACPHCGQRMTSVARIGLIALAGLALLLLMHAVVLRPIFRKMGEMDEIQRGMITEQRPPKEPTKEEEERRQAAERDEYLKAMGD